MYPKLNNITPILEHPQVSKDITPKLLSDGSCVLCYQVLNTFDNITPELLECRGISYNPNVFVLLDIRDNFTGEYLAREKYSSYINNDILKTDSILVNFVRLLSVAEHNDKEGYVIRTGIANKEFIKLKSNYYLSYKQFMLKHDRPSYVAKVVVTNELDDLLLYAKKIKTITKDQYDDLLKFSSIVVLDYNKYKREILEKIKPYINMEMKDVVTSTNNNKELIFFTVNYKKNTFDDVVLNCFIKDMIHKYISFDSIDNQIGKIEHI